MNTSKGTESVRVESRRAVTRKEESARAEAREYATAQDRG
jgi:hypothetical protein